MADQVYSLAKDYPQVRRESDPQESTFHQLRTPHLEKQKCWLAEDQSVSKPIYTATVPMTPKEYQQARRESDPKTAPRTYSADRLWRSKNAAHRS